MRIRGRVRVMFGFGGLSRTGYVGHARGECVQQSIVLGAGPEKLNSVTSSSESILCAASHRPNCGLSSLP